MGKYQAYPEYKDSRIGWMGHIPKDWLTVPVGRLFSRTKRTGHSEKELLSVYRDYGVIPKSSRDDNNNKESDDLTPYQLVQPNDLVMNKMKAWQGSIAISEFEGIVSPAYFVYEPRNILFDLAHPRYIHYLLRNPIYITQYMSRSKGIRVNQWDLDPDEFKTIELLLPSKNEQSKIFNFLDHETAKIDALIEKQQQLISLLQEKRQAVISHAVTKGLNPDVPMKDSGVEWLRHVPEHWDIAPIKRVASFITGMTPSTSISEYYSDEETDFEWIRPEDIKEPNSSVSSSKFLTKRGWNTQRAVPAHSSLICCIGTIGKIGYVLKSVTTNQQITAATFYFSSKYYFYVLQAARAELEIMSAGNVVRILNTERLGRLNVPLIMEHEALTIANFLDHETAKIDALIEKQQQLISLLQEKRQAVISHAVTGKIDVRNWQAPSQSSTTSTEEQAL